MLGRPSPLIPGSVWGGKRHRFGNQCPWAGSPREPVSDAVPLRADVLDLSSWNPPVRRRGLAAERSWLGPRGYFSVPFPVLVTLDPVQVESREKHPSSLDFE